MSLSDFNVSAQIAVSDLDRAARFYEEGLGLRVQDEAMEGVRLYPCGGGTELLVYASPQHAGASTATVARWVVDDLERVVSELAARGVTFVSYDEPTPTDERGIHDAGYVKVAWVRDPDGNTLAVEQYAGDA